MVYRSLLAALLIGSMSAALNAQTPPKIDDDEVVVPSIPSAPTKPTPKAAVVPLAKASPTDDDEVPVPPVTVTPKKPVFKAKADDAKVELKTAGKPETSKVSAPVKKGPVLNAKQYILNGKGDFELLTFNGAPWLADSLGNSAESPFSVHGKSYPAGTPTRGVNHHMLRWREEFTQGGKTYAAAWYEELPLNSSSYGTVVTASYSVPSVMASTPSYAITPVTHSAPASSFNFGTIMAAPASSAIPCRT